MTRLPPMALFVLLGACSSPLPDTGPKPASIPAGPAMPAPARSTPPAPRDACGAVALQGMIGKPRSEIPVPLDPSRQRVACATCPVTMDFNPERLNFVFDAETGLIKEVRCG